MCLVSDDRIVVADLSNKSVKLLEVTTGHVLHRLQIKGILQGVCLMAGDRVAVTLTGVRRIQVLFFTFMINI